MGKAAAGPAGATYKTMALLTVYALTVASQATTTLEPVSAFPHINGGSVQPSLYVHRGGGQSLSVPHLTNDVGSIAPEYERSSEWERSSASCLYGHVRRT